MLRRLLREENGNVAVLAGIALPALALAAGFAVDHSLLVRTHVELQTTADAAALAGARRMWDSGESDTAAEEVAREEAANVIMARRSEATYVVSPSASDATVSVSVSVDQETIFGEFFGRDNRAVAAAATATYMGEARSGCLIALDDSASTNIRLQGAPRVRAPNCGVWSNATSAQAIRMQGAPSLQGSEVCAAGATGNAEQRISPEITTDCGAAPDPYRRVLSDIPTGCTHTNFSLPKKGTIELSPGVYCGGLEIDSIDVSLRPGLYVVKDGPLVLKGNGSLAGNEVALVLTGEGAALDLQGSPDISLSAMTTGDLAGIAIAVTDTGEEADRSELQGSPTLTLTGSIYLRGQQLVLQGNPAINLRGDADKIVARSFDLQGSPDISIAAKDTKIRSADIDFLRISH